MKNYSDIQDKIDSYLRGEMLASEIEAFENEMELDVKLIESVGIQKMIVDEIRERKSLFSIMQQAEKEGMLVPFLRSWKFYSAAATILIMIVLFIWQPGKMSNQEIVVQFAMVIPAPDFPDVRGDETVTIVNECPFSNLYPEECEIIKQALSCYEKEEYLNANTLFLQVLTPPERNEELALFMAISQFKIGEFQNALDIFTSLSRLPEFNYRFQVEYYLALTYIQNGDIKKARKTLRSLSENSKEFHAKAEEILQKLRWF